MLGAIMGGGAVPQDTGKIKKILDSHVAHIPRPFSSVASNVHNSMSRHHHQNAMLLHKSKNLLELPHEILDKIFSYVGYKKVAQIRVVSKSMNIISSSILNSSFQKLQTQLLNRFQNIKKNMPRRESSRRMHPLSFECDIVETCYMRLSLLQMTFGKHIDRKHICFFPGAILDEVYNTLNHIRNTPNNVRPHIITEELYDLSTMAMEYFKEHLEQHLPAIVNFNRDFIDYNFSKTNSKTKYLLDTANTPNTRKSSGTSSSHSSSIPSPPQSNMVLRKGIRKIKQGMKRYNNQLTVLRNDLRFCKKKSTEQSKQITEMQKLLAEQQKQTLEYAARLDENDKKNEEMSMKISTLLQEANKCKTELQYWRTKSPTAAVDAPYGQQQQIILDLDAADTLSQQPPIVMPIADGNITGGIGPINLSDLLQNGSASNHNNVDLELLHQVQIINENNIQSDLIATTTTTSLMETATVMSTGNGDILNGEGPLKGPSSVPIEMTTEMMGVGATTHELMVPTTQISSVICSVGLPPPPPSSKGNSKRKLDVFLDNSVQIGQTGIGNNGESTAGGAGVGGGGGGFGNASGSSVGIRSTAAGTSAAAGAGANGSDNKKARRVQNKARCQSSSNAMINSGKITRSK